MIANVYITRAYIWFISLLFPERCIGCNAHHTYICTQCIKKLTPSNQYISPYITAAFNYRDPRIQKAIWNIKYYNRSPLGPILGKVLYQTCIEKVIDIQSSSLEPIIVIPVPLSRERKRIRGYNQAEKIAQGFCTYAGVEHFVLSTKIVSKLKDTPPQARITEKTKRLKNIKGAYSVRTPAAVYGKTIIVIDDVTTTGGTFDEMRIVLTRAGAKNVFGFAVAH